MLESYHRRQDLRQQQERMRLRDLATILDGLGAILLHNMFPADGAAIRMKDVFPDLYHTDTAAEAQPTAADMELYKARRLHHAYCFNKNRYRQNREGRR